MSDVQAIKDALRERVEELAVYLFPRGKRESNQWCVGDITGVQGKSFKICLAGEKAGLWGDFAGGEKHSRSLLDLWMAARNVDLPTALHEAADWLGYPLSSAPMAPASVKGAEAANIDDQTIAALAALHPLEYDRQRKEKAKELNCREATLDKLVAAKRAQGNDTLQGSDVMFEKIELWPEPVDGAVVLDEVATKISSYVAVPDGAADAIALWIMHAHAFAAFVHSPRLNFRSPELGCGKTLALDVVAALAPRPLRTESITPAVLFRLVEKHKPTMLLDEVDSYLKEANELRGLLNAGYKRGALALRCEGEDNAVRCFAAFSPAALAGIGELPGTLHSRAIVIMLVRAKPGEVRERFDSRRTEKETELCRKCARWAADNFGALKDCDPQLPETAFNRVADNWRPLFSIAQVMGGDWPKRGSEAFAKLTSAFDLDAQGIGTMLLADIAAIFDRQDTDKLPSAKIADLLSAIEGRPWAEWGRQQKPISSNQIAKLLRRFGIAPQVIRISDETHRGYPLEQFQEAFDRYLPKTPLPGCNSVTMLGKTPFPDRNTEAQQESVLHPENGHSTYECYGVTLQTGGLEGEQCVEAVSDAADDGFRNLTIAGEPKDRFDLAFGPGSKEVFAGRMVQRTATDGWPRPVKCKCGRWGCGQNLEGEAGYWQRYNRPGLMRCNDCQEAKWLGGGYDVENGRPSSWLGQDSTVKERRAESARDELQKHECWARKEGLIEIANNCHEDAARFGEALLRARRERLERQGVKAESEDYIDV